jgi:hypothetical protein
MMSCFGSSCSKNIWLTDNLNIYIYIYICSTACSILATMSHVSESKLNLGNATLLRRVLCRLIEISRMAFLILTMLERVFGNFLNVTQKRGSFVVKALHYKSEGRG